MNSEHIEVLDKRVDNALEMKSSVAAFDDLIVKLVQGLDDPMYLNKLIKKAEARKMELRRYSMSSNASSKRCIARLSSGDALYECLNGKVLSIVSINETSVDIEYDKGNGVIIDARLPLDDVEFIEEDGNDE